MRLFGNDDKAKESSLDNVLLAVIRTVVDRAVSSDLQRSTLKVTLKQTMHILVHEPYIVDAVARCTIDALHSPFPWPSLLNMRLKSAPY